MENHTILKIDNSLNVLNSNEIIEEKEYIIDTSIQENNNAPIQNGKPIIKHIVISGGGAAGLSFLGVLQETYKKGLWNHSSLESIYATSVGSMCALLISLNIDFDIFINYYIKRPWEHLFKINNNFLQYFYKRGILGKNVVEEMFSPLFKYKGYEQNITLLELYNESGIDVHCFCTELNTFTLVDMSHKTHPNWRVIDVIYSSCCLPVLFEPFFNEGNIFIDGGILCNYPLEQCIRDKKPENENEILGIDLYNPPLIMKEDPNFFDYLNHLIFLLIYKIRSIEEKRRTLENEIIIYEYPKLYDIITVMNDIDKRRHVISIGHKIVQDKYS